MIGNIICSFIFSHHISSSVTLKNGKIQGRALNFQGRAFKLGKNIID
jgi:hypothetical protein